MKTRVIPIGAVIAIFACSAPEEGVEQGSGGSGGGNTGGSGATPSGGTGGAGGATGGTSAVGGTAGTGTGGGTGATGGAPSGGGGVPSGGGAPSGGGTGGTGGATGGTGGVTGGTGGTGGGASCSGPGTGCDPVHPDKPWPGFTACAAGSHCFLSSGTFKCGTAGPGGEGYACSSNTQCKPGFLCDLISCWQVCFDTGDCGGKTCKPTGQTLGSCSVGHCE